MVNYINNYFLILFSFFPISLILGSSASLINMILIDISFLLFLFYLKAETTKTFLMMNILYALIQNMHYVTVTALLVLPKRAKLWRWPELSQTSSSTSSTTTI